MGDGALERVTQSLDRVRTLLQKSAAGCKQWEEGAALGIVKLYKDALVSIGHALPTFTELGRSLIAKQVSSLFGQLRDLQLLDSLSTPRPELLWLQTVGTVEQLKAASSAWHLVIDLLGFIKKRKILADVTQSLLVHASHRAASVSSALPAHVASAESLVDMLEILCSHGIVQSSPHCVTPDCKSLVEPLSMDRACSAAVRCAAALPPTCSEETQSRCWRLVFKTMCGAYAAQADSLAAAASDAGQFLLRRPNVPHALRVLLLRELWSYQTSSNEVARSNESTRAWANVADCLMHALVTKTNALDPDSIVPLEDVEKFVIEALGSVPATGTFAAWRITMSLLFLRHCFASVATDADTASKAMMMSSRATDMAGNELTVFRKGPFSTTQVRQLARQAEQLARVISEKLTANAMLAPERSVQLSFAQRLVILVVMIARVITPRTDHALTSMPTPCRGRGPAISKSAVQEMSSAASSASLCLATAACDVICHGAAADRSGKSTCDFDEPEIVHSASYFVSRDARVTDSVLFLKRMREHVKKSQTQVSRDGLCGLLSTLVEEICSASRVFKQRHLLREAARCAEVLISARRWPVINAVQKLDQLLVHAVLAFDNAITPEEESTLEYLANQRTNLYVGQLKVQAQALSAERALCINGFMKQAREWACEQLRLDTSPCINEDARVDICSQPSNTEEVPQLLGAFKTELTNVHIAVDQPVERFSKARVLQLRLRSIESIRTRAFTASGRRHHDEILMAALSVHQLALARVLVASREQEGTDHNCSVLFEVECSIAHAVLALLPDANCLSPSSGRSHSQDSQSLALAGLARLEALLRATKCQSEDCGAACSTSKLHLLQAELAFTLPAEPANSTGLKPSHYLDQTVALWKLRHGVADQEHAEYLSCERIADAANAKSKNISSWDRGIALAELSEAAYKYELLSLPSCAASALAVALTIDGSAWWRINDVSMVDASVEGAAAATALLYRLTSALSRAALNIDASEHAGIIRGWWSAGEAAWQSCSARLEPKQKLAIHNMRLEAWNALPLCCSRMNNPAMLAAVHESRDLVVASTSQLALLNAEALLNASEFCSTWLRSDSTTTGAVVALCSALYALDILKKCPKLGAVTTAHVLSSWSTSRYLCLLLRVLYHIGALYERIGAPQYSDHYFLIGTRVLTSAAPAAVGLRFKLLCARARLASAGWRGRNNCSSVSLQPDGPSRRRALPCSLEADGDVSTSEEEPTKAAHDFWSSMISTPCAKDRQTRSSSAEILEAQTRHHLVQIQALGAVFGLASTDDVVPRAALGKSWNRLITPTTCEANGLLMELLLSSQEVEPAPLAEAIASLDTEDAGCARLTGILFALAAVSCRLALQAGLQDGSSMKAEVVAETLRRCADLLQEQPAKQWRSMLGVLDNLRPASTAVQLLQVALTTSAVSMNFSFLHGYDAYTRRAAQQLLKLTSGASACLDELLSQREGGGSPANLERDSSRSRSRSRSPRYHHDHDDATVSAVHRINSAAVPLSSGLTVFFLSELRQLQRRFLATCNGDAVNTLLAYCSEPLATSGCDATASAGDDPAIPIAEFSSGRWLARVPQNVSLAWVQVDTADNALWVSRRLDASYCVAAKTTDKASRVRVETVVSKRVELAVGVWQQFVRKVRAIESELRAAVKRWQAIEAQEFSAGKCKRSFWDECQQLDHRMAELVRGLQDEVLHEWRFLLNTWPQDLTESAEVSAAFRRWMTSTLAQPVHPTSEWLLAQLYLDVDSLSLDEAVSAMTFALHQRRSLQLEKFAHAMQQHRSQSRTATPVNVTSNRLPLSLFVDSVMGQLPLEACPDLAQLPIVRAIAPNVLLSGLALCPQAKLGLPARSSSDGYYVINPTGDTNTGVKTLNFLKEVGIDGSGKQWTGHVGQPGPPANEVQSKLACSDFVLYMGHTDSARRLLCVDRLERRPLLRRLSSGDSVGADEQANHFQAVVAVMACSSAKTSPVQVAPPSSMQHSSDQKIAHSRRQQFEAFGLQFHLLVEGCPAVYGALWDMLGGDLDILTRDFLQESHSQQRGTPASAEVSHTEDASEAGRNLDKCDVTLIRALRRAQSRRTCMLPHLTGAAIVCYGVPV